MSYFFFWVIPRRLNFICRRFGTLCLFHIHRQVGVKNEIGLRNVGVFIREKVWLKNSLSHPPSYWLRLFSSQIFSRINTPTFLKPISFFTTTCLWIWNSQSVPRRRHINFRRRGITQKKAYNNYFFFSLKENWKIIQLPLSYFLIKNAHKILRDKWGRVGI